MTVENERFLFCKMNQQSKKLLFNKSTLLSLKAELLKKQEEVKGKKQLPQHSAEHHKPPPASRISSTTTDQPTFNDKLNKEVDVDELEAHRRSKSALEKKAELYAHLSEGAGASQFSDRFLVDFANKRDEPPPPLLPPPPDFQEPELDGDYDDDDDDWTNFTDCLGRTRRCLKTDLESYRRRDEQLTRSMLQAERGRGEAAEPPPPPPPPDRPPEQEAPSTEEKPLLMQKTDAYLQSLRDKWEKKERELMEQDGDVHYQDLLFDEARAHGVGYYAFSTEEAARRREQAELARARVDTQRAQAAAATRRAERDALVAARVAAARARQRVRAGLPPEDPEQKKEEFTASLLDFLTEKKREAAEKAKEEERSAREAREAERQKIREGFVREWDVGKGPEGAEGPKREGFREMSQVEYEEQQRGRRVEEFAPPRNCGGEYARNTFDERGNIVGADAVKSWADVRPVSAREQYIEESPQQGLYFSTNESENRKRSRPYGYPPQNSSSGRFNLAHENRNESSLSTTLSVPVPIVNELEEEEEKPRSSKKPTPGAEIEPPPTYEYYGPESKRSRPQGQNGADAREAYEQGLKFLQSMESKKTPAKSYDFIM